MSHHLRTDETYLSQLARVDIPYIGLLGPRHRRERLLDAIGDAALALRDRVHGPAGIDIGGRDPESIALSIVAEAHQVLVAARRI
jgi:xanthine/CO dehydrogenase XdhC/CoxF family maturation factor